MKLSQLPNIADAKSFELLNPIIKKSFEPKAYISIFYHESKPIMNSLQNAQRKILSLMQDKENLTKSGDLKDELLNKVNLNHLSNLIGGWDGLEDEDGNPLEFNRENATKLMQNEIIFNFVVSKASEMGNFSRE